VKIVKERENLEDLSVKLDGNIKIRFKEIEFQDLCSVRMIQDRIQKWGFVNMIIDIQVPYKARNLMMGLATISFETSVKGNSFGPEIFLSSENLRASGRTHADFVST
jgi:hypothetical protein